MSDTVKLALDMGEKWGVVLLDDRPIAVAGFDGATYSIRHEANYVERESALSPDVFDAMTGISTMSKKALLLLFKAAIADSEVGMGNFNDCEIEIVE